MLVGPDEVRVPAAWLSQGYQATIVTKRPAFAGKSDEPALRAILALE
jgi:hypothetical protein